MAYAIDIAATHFFDPDTGSYRARLGGPQLHAGPSSRS